MGRKTLAFPFVDDMDRLDWFRVCYRVPGNILVTQSLFLLNILRRGRGMPLILECQTESGQVIRLEPGQLELVELVVEGIC